MAIAFKQIVKNQLKYHFRILEKDSVLIKRTFNQDNSYIDTDLEDLELSETFPDLPF